MIHIHFSKIDIFLFVFVSLFLFHLNRWHRIGLNAWFSIIYDYFLFIELWSRIRNHSYVIFYFLIYWLQFVSFNSQYFIKYRFFTSKKLFYHPIWILCVKCVFFSLLISCFFLFNCDTNNVDNVTDLDFYAIVMKFVDFATSTEILICLRHIFFFWFFQNFFYFMFCFNYIMRNDFLLFVFCEIIIFFSVVSFFLCTS